MIIDVPYINQMPKWPTGCESVSAVMLMQYWGVNIDVDEFITYLPQKKLVSDEKILKGYSPYQWFIGTPYDAESYGCYAPVIASTINTIINKGHLALNCADISGLSTKKILDKYILKGMPVLYWMTIDLKPSVKGPCWQLADSPEKTFTWISNEHCLVLTGVDETGYWFNDPWNNHGVVHYPKEIVEKRHKEMLQMAVAIERT